MDDQRRQLVDNIRIAIASLSDETEILTTAAEMIDGYSDGYNWTGFYMIRDDHLQVGPYVGPKTEHTKIELNRGICGAAASSQKTIRVRDVQADPRFLSCSLSTRSEIVVPLMDGTDCLGEIDIDSDQPSFFSDQDQTMLEDLATVIVARLRKL
jgi:GAF domain-containing protein